MILNKKVVAAIHRFVANPDRDTMIKLIKTGTIFRYLTCQAQLGEKVIDQLTKSFEEALPYVNQKDLMCVYRALNRGLVSHTNPSNFVRLKDFRPSQSMDRY